MNWRILVEEAKMLGYKIEKDEVWNEESGLHFTKEGDFYYYRKDDDPTVAMDRKYDMMFHIMRTLSKYDKE